MSELILVADDDPDILRFVELNLRLEGYEVITASEGTAALALARDRVPSLAILDVMMPEMDGLAVCEALRTDPRTASVCVIMLTARSMSADRVVGLTAGADDYIGKPFDPMELVARVKTTLRRSREMRAVSPLTGLPGNVQIEAEMRRRVAGRERFAVLHVDLDQFKAFNDCYGWVEGDKAIAYLATILGDVGGARVGAYVGHIGGDDFVVLCTPDDAEGICEAITKRFDQDVASLYAPEDAANGHIVVKDRAGHDVRFPLLTVSVGGATNEAREVSDHRDLVEWATEMKAFAKSKPGSAHAIDRRREAGAP